MSIKLVNPSRRHLLKQTGLAAGVLAMPGILRKAHAAEELNVITYAGFVPDEFRAAFEAETGIRLNIRLSDDLSKVYGLLVTEASSPTTDLTISNSVNLPDFLKSEILEPLDPARVTGLDRIVASHRDSADFVVDGNRWGIPTLVASQVLAYNNQKLSNVTSWGELFDEKNSGRIAWRINDFLVLVLHYLGYDGNLVEYMGDDAKAQEVTNIGRDFLISKKHLVRKMYTNHAEVQQMFVNDEIDVANMWSGPATTLILDGQPISRIIPKEGSFGSTYATSLVKGAPNPDGAYKFLNAMLAYQQMGELMTRSTGFGSVFVGATDNMTAEEKAAYSFSEEELGRIQRFREDNITVRDELFRKAEAEIQAA